MVVRRFGRPVPIKSAWGSDTEADAMRRWLPINLEPVLFRGPKEASGLEEDCRVGFVQAKSRTCRRRR